jgi:hypothetical protein
MPPYSPHPIIKHLEASPYFDHAPDAWSAFCDTFAVASPEFRLESLNAIDQHMAIEDRPTHRHAELINMRRQLVDLHSRARSVNR